MFVERYNALAQFLATWENFKTKRGELRPLVLQEVHMTVARILGVSAHLLASTERHSQIADFWDLVDLYASFRGDDVAELFSEKFFDRTVVPALRTMPGALGGLFGEQASTLLSEWTAEIVRGITDPSIVEGDTITITVARQRFEYTGKDFLKRHIAARRHTLHGYSFSRWARSPKREADAALLGLHDGSLPLRMPEWGRIMLLVLLCEPTRVIRKDML